MSVFPLKSAYPYLKNIDSEHIYYETDKMNTPDGKRKSTLRRGRIILFLEEKGLLADFIDKFWLEGRTTKEGKSNIESCKNFYFKVSENNINKENIVAKPEEKQVQNVEKNNLYEKESSNTSQTILKKTSLISNNDNSSNLQSSTLTKSSSCEQLEGIVRETKELIRLVNQNRKNSGKNLVFKETDLFEVLLDIEKRCLNSESLNVFSSALYKLVVESSRYENPNFRYTGYFHESNYPKDIWKEPAMLDFINDVKTIRHEFAHTKSDKKESKKRKAEVLNKYLCNMKEPRLPEKFLEFQTGILAEFVNFLKKLLQYVEDELNPEKKS